MKKRHFAAVLVFFATLPLAVRGLAFGHGMGAGALYDGDVDAQRELARGVDRWIDEDLARNDFSTGDPTFDGEWLFATRMFAVLGYAQSALEHPELAEAHAPKIERCLAALTSEDAQAFDREKWGGVAPLDDLGSDRPHVAFLGYLALALALARAVDPDNRFVELEERIIAHLVPLFEASSLGLLETYPDERFPIDNTSFFGALGLHDRITGDDHSALLTRLHRKLGDYRDPEHGLLFQQVDARGEMRDGPRGSGTALASYFLSFSDMRLSRSLYRSIQTHMNGSFLGFGGTREYPPGVEGWGDVDSGPVIVGAGVSVSGFTLALARIHGDRDTFVRNYATAAFAGGPIDRDGTHFALGGPMGDALLFGLVTARPQ
jgi:hypothetical protein